VHVHAGAESAEHDRRVRGTVCNHDRRPIVQPAVAESRRDIVTGVAAEVLRPVVHLHAAGVQRNRRELRSGSHTHPVRDTHIAYNAFLFSSRRRRFPPNTTLGFWPTPRKP